MDCAVQYCHRPAERLLVGRAYWRGSGTQHIELHVCSEHADHLEGRNLELFYPDDIGGQASTRFTFPVKLTPRAQRILHAAPVQARAAGVDDFIGVEHIFLAILDDEESVPTQAVNRLIDARRIREELEATLASEEYRTSTGQILGDDAHQTAPEDALQGLAKALASRYGDSQEAITEAYQTLALSPDDYVLLTTFIAFAHRFGVEPTALATFVRDNAGNRPRRLPT